jgi:hypothetical protein
VNNNLNPLVEAIQALERHFEAVDILVCEVTGERAFKQFDEQLHDAAMALVYDASEAVAGLGPRARRARLNLIWRDFLTKHQARDIKGSSNAGPGKS